MKYLYNTNKIILIITALLYLTLILGLYAQIVLGAVQVISSFLLLAVWSKMSNLNKQKLFMYWIITSVYGMCWLFDWQSLNSEYFWVLAIIVIPMGIAVYFQLLLNKINKEIKQKNSINQLDQLGAV
ncbi:hypothetical protein [Lacinutrix salivirga]